MTNDDCLLGAAQSALRVQLAQQEELERAQGLIIEVDDVTPV